MRRILSVSIVALATGFLLAVGFHDDDIHEAYESIRVEVIDVEKPVAKVITQQPKKELYLEIEEEEELITTEEIELIALLTMAEAEGECELGKRLVIDTVLNRVDHDDFPDTVSEVVYQPRQFSSMWNGRVDRCSVLDDILDLVKEELESRTNDDVLFFHAGKYGKYGDPVFQVGNHYFSSY